MIVENDHKRKKTFYWSAYKFICEQRQTFRPQICALIGIH